MTSSRNDWPRLQKRRQERGLYDREQAVAAHQRWLLGVLPYERDRRIDAFNARGAAG